MPRHALAPARLCALLTCFAACAYGGRAQQVRPAPPISEPQLPSAGKTMPLLSLDNLRFLEGTWSAVTRDGLQTLGTYTFVRELNGTVLARNSSVDASCDPAKQPACARRDLFYIYQDSKGAPLKAISFDSEGHVLHYLVSQNAQASTSTFGRRDFVIFDTDPSQFGPRMRLRYERNLDTQTGKDSLSGVMEMLQPNGAFRPLQEWYGVRQ